MQSVVYASKFAYFLILYRYIKYTFQVISKNGPVNFVKLQITDKCSGQADVFFVTPVFRKTL